MADEREHLDNMRQIPTHLPQRMREDRFNGLPFDQVDNGPLMRPRPMPPVLDQLLAEPPGPPVAASLLDRKAQTKVGIAFLQNSTTVVLSLAGLLLQIDERLVSLREQRWNSDEQKALRDEAIANYEDLKEKVEAVLDVATQFLTASAPEANLVEKTTSFAATLSNIWAKRHLRAFDVGLFLSGAGICHLLGTDPNLAAGICGGLVGGSRMVDLIKTAWGKVSG